MTRHRALVVEDDPDIADLVVMSIESAAVQVTLARNGRTALEIAREIKPDLITLDLTLPDMDGVEVCRGLREFSDAYIIMITGRTQNLERLVGPDIGADDYLAKPFSPKELRLKAAAALDGRASKATSPDA